MTLPTELPLDEIRELLEESGRKKDNPLLALGAALVLAQAKAERLLAVLKGIAESPESRDALQVWAWQTYTRESSERWVLADDPQNPANQVPDFSKVKP